MIIPYFYPISFLPCFHQMYSILIPFSSMCFFDHNVDATVVHMAGGVPTADGCPSVPARRKRCGSRRRSRRKFGEMFMVIWQCVKTLYPCSSHQNSWDLWDVHPTKNGINRYWSIPIWHQHTVDGCENPAPVDRWFIPLFLRVSTCFNHPRCRISSIHRMVCEFHGSWS